MNRIIITLAIIVLTAASALAAPTPPAKAPELRPELRAAIQHFYSEGIYLHGMPVAPETSLFATAIGGEELVTAVAKYCGELKGAATTNRARSSETTKGIKLAISAVVVCPRLFTATVMQSATPMITVGAEVLPAASADMLLFTLATSPEKQPAAAPAGKRETTTR